MSTDDDNDLSASWQVLRGPSPTPVDATNLFPGRNPGDFVLGTSSGREILRITKEGQVRLAEDVSLDDASELFWTNLALKRVGMEERLTHLGIVEGLLIQVGRADLAYEAAQGRATTEGATEHDRFMEEMSRRDLEGIVHRLIEFARALAQRPPIVGPEDPR